jgi:hypothetical protein
MSTKWPTKQKKTVEACAGECVICAPALSDTDAILATPPARLTVTFGFGKGCYRPPTYRRLGIDRLERRWSGGHLLLLRRRPADGHVHTPLPDRGRPAVRHAPAGCSRASTAVPAYLRSCTASATFSANWTVRPTCGGVAVIDPAVWNFAGSSTLVVQRVWAEIERVVHPVSGGQGERRAATARRQASRRAAARPSACRMQRRRAEESLRRRRTILAEDQCLWGGGFMRVLSQESWREVSLLACCAMARRSRSRRP